MSQAELSRRTGISVKNMAADVEYEVNKADIKILKQIHSLGEEQYMTI